MLNRYTRNIIVLYSPKTIWTQCARFVKYLISYSHIVSKHMDLIFKQNFFTRLTWKIGSFFYIFLIILTMKITFKIIYFLICGIHCNKFCNIWNAITCSISEKIVEIIFNWYIFVIQDILYIYYIRQFFSLFWLLFLFSPLHTIAMKVFRIKVSTWRLLFKIRINVS